jgi:hypothetical protein
MATTIHGGLPQGIRDKGGVFGAPNDAPSARLQQARAKGAELKRNHAEAQSTLRLAVEDEGGTYDFQALKSNVHRLARELAEAEEQAENWESVCAQVDKADRARQFDEKLLQAREARAKFAELYCDTCLALGRWYRLGAEIRELVNALADRLPNGTIYHPPHLKNALQELNEDPNPLPALKDGGYSEITTTASWRRHVAAVPLVAKEK